MTEPATKKYAEVAAFVAVADDMQQRAGSGLTDQAPVVAEHLSLITSLTLPAVPADMSPVFEAKRSKTITKLTNMMELYIGDEWDNPTEVLEWSSFFAGAAAAHCAVTRQRIGDPASDEAAAIASAMEALEPQASALLEAVIATLGGRTA